MEISYFIEQTKTMEAITLTKRENWIDYSKVLFIYLSINTLTTLGIHLQLFRLLPGIDAFVGAAIVLVYCLPIIWLLNSICPTLIGNKRKKYDYQSLL